jgi:uncharacterized OB-fold protein
MALVVIVLLYLARPFAMPEDEDVRVNREEIDGLLLRKEALLREIRELDDDYESAKVAPELYAVARPQMMKQAALIMKQLDDHGYVEEGRPVAANVDAQIEAAVRRARAPEQVDEQLEAAIRQARRKSTEAAPATAAPSAPVAAAAAANVATQFCPQCGRRVESGDRFCPKCGYNLVQESKPAQAARA